MFSHPLRANLSRIAARESGVLAVVAVLVRETGVGIAGHERRRRLVDCPQMIGHVFGAGRAIEPDSQRLDMLKRHGQGLSVLAGEHGPHRLDRAGDDDRQPESELPQGVSHADQGGPLTLRVSWHVSSSSRSECSASARVCSRYVEISCSKVMPPVTLIDFVDGPIAPATNTGRPGLECASAALPREPSRLQIDPCDLILEPVFGQHDVHRDRTCWSR